MLFIGKQGELFDLMRAAGHTCYDVDDFELPELDEVLRERVVKLLHGVRGDFVVLQFGNSFDQSIYRLFSCVAVQSLSQRVRVVFLSSAKVFQPRWLGRFIKRHEMEIMCPKESDDAAMHEFWFTIATHDFQNVKTIRVDEIGAGILFDSLQSFIARWNKMPNILHFAGSNSDLSNSRARSFGFRFL